MKIILTGATGFIGAEVLRFALLHPRITSIIALSRRQLPVKHPKLTVLIVSDWLNYSSSIIEACAGAEACIWSLGVARSLSPEQNWKINVDYTMYATRTFTEKLGSRVDDEEREEGKFRFVYLSGMLTERDPEKRLWFMREARLIRGEVETRLMELQREHEKFLLTYVVRPGGVQAPNSFFPGMLQPLFKAIIVDDLAVKMLDTAINGHKTQIIEVDVLRDEGKRLKKEMERT